MKIYTDAQNRIIDVDSTQNLELTELEIPDGHFGDITTGQIKCYSCILDANGFPAICLLVPPGVFDQIGQLDRQHEADQEEVTNLQLALAEEYEAGLARDEEITNTQLAITEIYEGMEV